MTMFVIMIDCEYVISWVVHLQKTYLALSIGKYISLLFYSNTINIYLYIIITSNPEIL